MAEKLTPLVEWAAKQGIPYQKAYRLAREGEIPTRRVRHLLMVVEEAPEEEEVGRVFTFFTHAGGAGKTSLARDLGFEAASRGYRVLLVDMDPQANLSDWLGVEVDRPEKETALAVLEEGGGLPNPAEVLPNLYLVPSHVELARAEATLFREPHQTLALRGALEEIRREFHLILVDSLPSLGTLAVSAALAGDGLIVPVELSRKGVQALPTVLKAAQAYAKTLRRVRLWEGGNFIRMIIPTGAEGTARDRQTLQVLKEQVGDSVPIAPPVKRRPAVYREAQAQAAPVQVVGDEAVREEMRALGNFFLHTLELGFEEEVRV
jgi:chromosome partitioning protein